MEPTTKSSSSTVAAQKEEYIGRAGKRGQGPFMYISLEVTDTRVHDASFETFGCPSALRCGDWVAKWVKGRELTELNVITWQDLALVVGGLPMGKTYLAEITINALKDAITQAADKQKALPDRTFGTPGSDLQK